MKQIMVGILMLLVLAGCTGSRPQINDNGKPGEIQVFIFHDANANDRMDAGEAGLADKFLVSTNDTCPPVSQKIEPITRRKPAANFWSRI